MECGRRRAEQYTAPDYNFKGGYDRRPSEPDRPFPEPPHVTVIECGGSTQPARRVVGIRGRMVWRCNVCNNAVAQVDGIAAVHQVQGSQKSDG